MIFVTKTSDQTRQKGCTLMYKSYLSSERLAVPSYFLFSRYPLLRSRPHPRARSCSRNFFLPPVPRARFSPGTTSSDRRRVLRPKLLATCTRQHRVPCVFLIMFSESTSVPSRFFVQVSEGRRKCCTRGKVRFQFDRKIHRATFSPQSK